jgi:DNA helicase-2/ATP-dependent DNA helicase PcrA
MHPLIADLNPRQREAVLHRGSPLLVLAGAGSGKTRVITRRIAHMVAEGVAPGTILALTFTNKAAREMADRVRSLISEESMKGITLGTFHAIGLQILDKEGDKLGLPAHRALMDAGDQQAAVRQCLKELRMDPKSHDVMHILEVISGARHRFKSPADVAREPGRKLIARIYKAYLEQKTAYGRLDFDDLILKPIELFKTHPDVLNKWRKRFGHILVDEFQDTSLSQLEFLKLLASEHRRICVVGDDDQSIYGWRGARIENILNFEHTFSDAKAIALEQNYRSTGHILDAANAVIVKNTLRRDKKLWTDAGPGAKLESIRVPDERAEATFVAATIQKLVREEGRRYSDVGVLFRTGAQAQVVENSLNFSEIPYRTSGTFDFFDRKEVKDLVAWLKLVQRPSDWTSFMRAVAFPSRGVGAQTIERLVTFSKTHNQNVHRTLESLDRIPGLTSSAVAGLKSFRRVLMDTKDKARKPHTDCAELVSRLCAELGVRESLIRDPTQGPGGERRWRNIELLMAAIRRLQKRKQVSNLREILRLLALERQALSEEAKEDQVSMMTFHAAKGLEWPVVFMIGCEEGLLPHQRTLDEASGTDEERRLFYVGITRARERAYLSYGRRRLRGRQSVDVEPSRFMLDISLDHRNHTDRGIQGFEVERSEASRRFEALKARLNNSK